MLAVRQYGFEITTGYHSQREIFGARPLSSVRALGKHERKNEQKYNRNRQCAQRNVEEQWTSWMLRLSAS